MGVQAKKTYATFRFLVHSLCQPMHEAGVCQAAASTGRVGSSGALLRVTLLIVLNEQGGREKYEVLEQLTGAFSI